MPWQVRTRPGTGFIDAFCDAVQVVLEQPAVNVERHGCGGVAQHPLDGLYVGAGSPREAGRGVPQVVRCEVLQPDRSASRLELRRKFAMRAPRLRVT